MIPVRRSSLAIVALAAVGACSWQSKTTNTSLTTGTSSVQRTSNASASPPAFLLGDFQDDYGARFTVSTTDFFQRPRNHYRIVRWDVANQFFIAQNDSANTSDRNKWTRVDWVKLDGMAPFEWAFCFSAYNANSQREAEATTVARRDTPRTGCSGFPFSRMKRAS